MPILSSFGGLSAIGRGQRAGGRKRVDLVISANTNNYVLNTAKVSGLGYEPGNTDVVLTINAGVVVGSASTGSFAFDVDTSWSSLDSVSIINNGTICGVGGNGGSGGIGNNGCCYCCNSINGYGSAGGPALRAQRALLITNSAGVIGGGGGGGGGGGVLVNSLIGSGGGGGGQGAANSSGGAAGYVSVSACETPYNYYYGSAGGTGTVSSAGGGGGLGGASGGAFGSSGGSGTKYDCFSLNTSGGAGGACTSGNSNITWLSTGTRYGALN